MNVSFRYGFAAWFALTALALPAQAVTTLTDASGREVAIGDASRIVSIGGAVTEILYALGFDKNIVGIDSTSLYPPRAPKEKASVGYMRQLSAEGVLGLRPSVVLAIAGSGPRETISVLEAAKVPLVTVPDAYTEAGIVDKISLIARATGTSERAQCLIGRVQADLAGLDKLRAGITKPKRILFVLSFVNGRALASGRGTAADGIIKMAGAVNVIGDYDGYKPINDEAIIAARPDVVLSIERGGQGVLTSDVVFAHPAFSATPAAAQRSFVAMEGLYLLGFGPRTARAARDLAVTLYPDLKASSLQPTPANEAAACQE